MNINKRIHHEINGVSFGIYSSEDMKRLSVMQVENPIAFDGLGHANPKGLCDAAFGAERQFDQCSTCGLNENECGGHFGHISLPLPVFNPFLIRQLLQFLKMVCFSCHQLLFSPIALETIIAQMQALEYGLDSVVKDLDSLAAELLTLQMNMDAGTMRDYVKIQLQKRLQEELNKNKCNPKNATKTKNVLQEQSNMFKRFMDGKLIKPVRSCHICGSRKSGMTIVNNAIIVLTAGGAKPKKIVKSKKTQNQDEDAPDKNAEKNEMLFEVAGKAYLTPVAARDHLRALWEKESAALLRLFRFLNVDVNKDHSCPIDVFFLDTIPVPPNRFRPIRFLNGRQFEHEHTTALSQVIVAAEVLANSFRQAKDGGRLNTSSQEGGSAPSDRGKDIAKFHMAWQRLQILCNRIYDSDMDRLPDNKSSGVKQTLEKKEGLFRKHMMGKRVNYAARSVISPDPYIMVDEIGIPLVFATKLSYPQPVTQWNLNQLQQMVLNGPDVHPGAVSVQMEDGTIIRLKNDNADMRKSIADRLSSSHHSNPAEGGVKIVNRHLISGDVLLLNRQPTLHKPSIMAHKARVLPREKTLRLHYANCKCYNADFDGDEMNAHFPQSELARAEAYQIASVNFQYLVPKDGSPLSGLIQDHIIAGVLLTMRGRFFSKGDYQELIYSSLSFLNKPIKMLPPSILKPKQLWSGKQIVSTLILNIVPSEKPPPTLTIASKISPKIFQSSTPRKYTSGGTPLQLTDMCESQVIIRHGELLCGIIDKVNLGPNAYGLIHCCYELYGGTAFSALLTSFARLCTNYLQIHHGFTLGIHDILVKDKPNAKRRKYINRSKHVGDKAAGEALGITNIEDKVALKEKLQDAHINKNDYYMKLLDKSMKSQTDEINNKITEVCMPYGLIKSFPDNNLQLMIQAGAKGGSVNAIQISCLLGQIELEGRRIPLMMSGRTLPSFKPYETSPRAGGFVAGRFMTGIRPQEFFFHCMAGREGLIDTAVKTSRSGYLQRCLIKHLEGLVVNYDLTVRDSEGSVVQLLYGEDGLDITKSQMLTSKTMPILIQNNDALKMTDDEMKKLKISTDREGMKKQEEEIKNWVARNGLNRLVSSKYLGFTTYACKKTRKHSLNKDQLVTGWYELNEQEKLKYERFCGPCPSPINNLFQPDVHFGAISENLDSLIENYIANNPHNLLDCDDPSSISSEEFRKTMHRYCMKSMCHPGEAVGLLAAQSIGEPSTQMTLNTFHFAGRGEMNVTLGIPRLREILMTASDKIATPSMDIPFLTNYPGNIEEVAESVRLRLNAVRLSDVLEYVDVHETLEVDDMRFRVYDLKFYFLPRKLYKTKCYTKPANILNFMEGKFFKILLESINRKMKSLAKSHGLFDHSSRVRTSVKSKQISEDDDEPQEYLQENSGKETPDKEDEMSSEDEMGETEGDTTSARHKSRHNQDLEYEEPEDDEIQVVPDSDAEETFEDDNEAAQVSRNEEEDLTVFDEDSKTSQNELDSAELARKQAKVCSISPSIKHYEYDTKKKLWCHIRFKFDLTHNKLDMASLIEEEARKAFVHKVGAIDRAFLVRDPEAAKRGAHFDKMLKTEGVSLLDTVRYDYALDINRIYSNDIHAIANTYGIEAAARLIQQEISNVFSVYGIQVDYRHLSLISDYMTFTGTIKGMNRMAMDGVSPIQAMTFETTTNFLKSAINIGIKDNLASPSARIVVGRPSGVGTGNIETLFNPMLFTGKVHNQSFGNEIHKNKWRNRQSKKPVKRRRQSIDFSFPRLNKIIKFD